MKPIICIAGPTASGKSAWAIQIAKSFGGGGHAFASGAMVHKSIEEAKSIIVKKSKEMIQNQLETS